MEDLLLAGLRKPAAERTVGVPSASTPIHLGRPGVGSKLVLKVSLSLDSVTLGLELATTMHCLSGGIKQSSPLLVAVLSGSLGSHGLVSVAAFSTTVSGCARSGFT